MIFFLLFFVIISFIVIMIIREIKNPTYIEYEIEPKEHKTNKELYTNNVQKTTNKNQYAYNTQKSTNKEQYTTNVQKASSIKKNYAENIDKDFRDLFPKPFRCKDGDYVRSKTEREIDDFFFDNRIWHIYEQEYSHPTTGKKSIPDFYLPDYNLYIEYFGSSDVDYIKKRDAKIEMYNSDPSIKFVYLTYKDDSYLHDRLRAICKEHSITPK